ncbi:MAG TPA: hypothetical protein VJJ22_04810, partial [Candidatus Paceibacterota bacterium]
AKEAFRAFVAANEAVLDEHRRLKGEVSVATWPPAGSNACEHSEENGEESCDALFPVGTTPPEGWYEVRYTCGCGGSGTFFCPAHAEQWKKEYEGESHRCDTCAN